MSSRFRVRAYLSDWNSKVSILLGTLGDNPRVVKPITFELIDHDRTEEIEPSLELTRDTAQELLNELWAMGLRPENGESSLAHIEAMNKTITILEKSQDAFIKICESQLTK